jgi:hypothetical protein
VLINRLAALTIATEPLPSRAGLLALLLLTASIAEGSILNAVIQMQWWIGGLGVVTAVIIAIDFFGGRAAD